MKCDGVGEPRGCCRGRGGFPAPLGGGVRGAPGVCGRGWPELQVLRPHLQPPAASAPVHVRLGRPGGRHVGRDRGHRGECGDAMGGLRDVLVTISASGCGEGGRLCRPSTHRNPITRPTLPQESPPRALCTSPQAGGGDPTGPVWCSRPSLSPTRSPCTAVTRWRLWDPCRSPALITAQVAFPGPRHQGVIPPCQIVTFCISFQHTRPPVSRGTGPSTCAGRCLSLLWATQNSHDLGSWPSSRLRVLHLPKSPPRRVYVTGTKHLQSCVRDPSSHPENRPGWLPGSSSLT